MDGFFSIPHSEATRSLHRDGDDVIRLLDDQSICQREERGHAQTAPVSGAHDPGGGRGSALPVLLQHHLVSLGHQIQNAQLAVGVQP